MSKTIISKLHAAIPAVSRANLNIPELTNLLKQTASTSQSALRDLFNRQHTYLRVSLTERCNLRCTYCMPEQGVKLTQNDKLLTGDEIAKLVKFFVKLGVNKVRFTGGEPLIRKDCVDIIKEVGRIDGLKKIAMTTNGILLARRIKELKEYGLNQLNVSLDTLEEKKFEFVAKRKGWSKVMSGIEAALDVGYSPLKINCVVMKGINDDEICDFIEMTRNKDLDVRFIEYMPFDGNKWNTKKMVSYREMLKQIGLKYPIEHIEKLKDDANDTSKAFRIKNYRGQFGFITSMTEHFCNTCNRIRLTADGHLKVCLFGNAEVSLRDALRNNLNEEELEELISSAITRKKEKHADRFKPYSANIKHTFLLSKQSSYLNSNSNYARFYSSLSLSDKNNASYSLPSSDQVKHSNKYSKCLNEQLTLKLNKSTCSNSQEQLTHFDNQTGRPRQVDISDKKAPGDQKPVRVACASGYIQLNQHAYTALVENKLKKGNALIVAQLAGIQASKQTQNLIPLCHQILLDMCDVQFELDAQANRIRCQAVCKTSSGKTGVEMEALTACSVALLTIYDMSKAVQKDAVINEIKLEYKFGGKSDFNRS